MKRFKVYSFALLFLIIAEILTVLLAIAGEKLPGREYFNPIGQISLFGPMLASLFFIAIIKKDRIADISFKTFDYKPLLKVILIYFLAVLIERIIQLLCGFSVLQINSDRVMIFNTELNPITGSFIYAILTTIFAGFGEEFGWRGYLFHKLKGLQWVELVLVMNTIWALWHLPMFLFGGMSKGEHILISFPLFIIACIEFGILLLYVRIKTKSVVASMILHPCANIFMGVISLKLIRVENNYFAGWPNVIAVIIILPIAIYFYKKGKYLYELDFKKINTS